MKYGFFIIILLELFITASNYPFQDNQYDVRNIPGELLSDPGAVIRINSVHFKIFNDQDAVQEVRYAVTIYKKDKQDMGELVLPYNKYVEISDLDGTIYDKNGEEVRNLESSDVKDYSNFSDYSLYDDNRLKYAELYYDKFPYTVEYTYEISYDDYINWPTWYSRFPGHCTLPVVQNEFTVTTPADYNLRYWCSRDSIMPVMSFSGDTKDYHWEANDLPELSGDAEYEDIQDLALIVRTAPATIEMDGYGGSMLTWKDFGYWYYELSQGKNILPESAVKDITENIVGSEDTGETIRRLYSYMQKRTHYVSIQLGIGGWQPFDASYVHTNGYGDCKALSNYMIAILEKAGIKAYPVLIYSGEQDSPFIEDFPSNQFNHVVVVVPEENDTLWLECTSQNMPAGSIGWSCENRKALMITREGGKLINTPVTKPADNLQSRRSVVKINILGKAEVDMHTMWTGDQHDYALSLSKNATFQQQEKWLKRTFKVPDIKLKSFLFNKDNKQSEQINLDLSVSLSRYATVSGKRIFFNPNIIDRRTNVPDDLTKKISPVRYNYPFLDVDTVKFILPVRYKVEAVPKKVDLETSFGRFISQTIANEDNSITFVRQLEIKDYTIPADEYNSYQDFFSKIVKSDRSQIVLSKK